MSSAAALRSQIEHALERRFPAALTPVSRTIRETAPTGIAAVDDLLAGGLPVGAISELTGPRSSGRTTLAISFLARKTQDEQVVAWVDSNDSLDPESAALGGVCLRQLLWVRCRSESAPVRGKPWSRLDQALRATDLLLQAGGFAAIVLDLGDIAPEHAARIPLATWFRFRQAADRTRCCLLILGQTSYAQSSAALVVECAPSHPKTAGTTVMNGFTFTVRRARVAAAFTSAGIAPRKPPVSTWSANSPWTQKESA